MPKLDCGEARTLLDAFDDNELDGVTSLAVQEHLEGCTECRAQRPWQAETRAALRRLRARTPGAPARLRSAWPRRPATGRLRRLRRGVAAALVFVAGVTAWQVWPAGAAEPMAFAQNHAASQERPDAVKFATADAAMAEAWLLGQLPYAFQVPRRAPEGFELAGARLCSVGSHRVAYLRYRRSGADGTLSLFIGPPGACGRDGLEALPGAGPALRRGQCGGTAVAAWEAAGATYVLAGAIAGPALAAYAQQEVAR